MAKNLNDVLAALPPKRRAKVEQRAGELATLKDLRLAVKHTQQDLTASLGVGQDTISRIEHRSDLCSPRYAAISGQWAANSIWSRASPTARPFCSTTSLKSPQQRRAPHLPS
ncbi:MAG: helix-turn-helix transcriptional regulator [Sideroxyarcus sp.]|nr:helix-turn-helix transcriptional regulator [Sideroxyarcus sp.]